MASYVSVRRDKRGTVGDRRGRMSGVVGRTFVHHLAAYMRRLGDMRRTAVLMIVLALALLAVAPRATAQGFGLWEQSACAIGRGGATVASPCPDASTIYFNPAGIVLTPGQTASAGATIVNPRGHFTNSTTGNVSDLLVKYYPVPNFYYKRNFKADRASAGIGVFAPYGLATDWPADTSEGRFLGYKSQVHSIFIQPTVAFKVNDKLAIGGGIDITRTSLELRQRLDLAAVAIPGTPYTFGTLPVGPVAKGTDFADVDITGDAWHVGFQLGAIVKPHEKVSFGVRYLKGQTVDVTSGTANYTQIQTGTTLKIPLGPTIPAGTPIDQIVAPNFGTGGKLSDQSASASIPLPDQFVAGIAVQATPKLMALVDYQFVRWSMFQSLTITQPIAGVNQIIENYGNTSGVRMGIDYAVNPQTSIRVGADFHGAAAPPETVTPNLPEGSRQEFSFGVGRKFGMARIDAYYMYLHQGDRAGRTVGPSSGVAPTTALNNGTYTFMSNLFGVTFAVGF
jgi:long-chain fatty acid transport protein